MKPSEAEFEKARAIADRVVRHALADVHFREELKTNPTAVLEKAGMSGGAIEDLEREIEIDGVALDAGCRSISCWWSCLFTCAHTFKTP
jgi:hypothetical protein